MVEEWRIYPGEFILAQPGHGPYAYAYCKGVAFGRASTLKAHISAIHLKIKRSRGAK